MDFFSDLIVFTILIFTSYVPFALMDKLVDAVTFRIKIGAPKRIGGTK